MLDQISQVAITLLGAISIILIAKKNKWGFVTGLISQPFWIATSLINEQWGVFINSILFTGSWLYGIYEWFYKNNKSTTTKNTMENINTKNALNLIKENKNDPNFIILDVRTSDEYQTGYIENAINIDFYSDSFEEDLGKLDKNKTYLIYCKSGNRSGRALKLMEKLKFKKVYNMQGGITTWENNKYSTIK